MERNEVEGVYGSGKRRYSLQLIMARLPKGEDTSASRAILVMRAEKVLRLLYLLCRFLSVDLLSSTSWPLLVAPRNIYRIETGEWPLADRPRFRPTFTLGHLQHLTQAR